MPRVVPIAGLPLMLCGCAQLLGVDDVVYRGGDGAVEAMSDASSPDADADADATSDAPVCDGPCPPTTVVTMNGMLPTLATDGTNVFFRTLDTVWSCATSGCGTSPTSVKSTSTTGLEVVAASMDLVVWTDGAKVFGCPPGACGIPKTYVDFTPAPVTGIAASTVSSFVVAAGGNSSQLAVHRVTLGGADTLVYSGSPGGGLPGPVAAVPSATQVYWSEVGAPTLFDCAQATCSTQPDHTVNSSGGSPSALLATPNALFVLTTSGLYIAPSPIASTQTFTSGSIAGVAITTTSTDRIYFAEGMTIQSCSTTPPCTPTTHHTGGAAITAIAADDSALYWIEGSSIMRLAL